jgi:hypothetical protein
MSTNDSLIQEPARHVLRAIALATTDDKAQSWLLKLLTESKQYATDALNLTCWQEDWHPNQQQYAENLRDTLMKIYLPPRVLARD